MATLTFIYAAIMLLLGIIGFLSNPEKAATSLIVGVATAALFTALAFFMRKGRKWAWTGVFIAGGLLSMMLVWRANITWMAYFGGDSHKLLAAILVSCMLVSSLVITSLSFTTRNLLRK